MTSKCMGSKTVAVVTRCVTVLLCMSTMLACDRLFVLKGVIVEPQARLTGAIQTSEGRPLASVEITLYARGRKSQGHSPVAIARTRSDVEGKYRLVVISPGRVAEDDFVEFAKPAYRTRRVHPLRGLAAEGIEAHLCTGEGDIECRVMNMVLVPE